jgi:hypothetical protein
MRGDAHTQHNTPHSDGARPELKLRVSPIRRAVELAARARGRELAGRARGRGLADADLHAGAGRRGSDLRWPTAARRGMRRRPGGGGARCGPASTPTSSWRSCTARIPSGSSSPASRTSSGVSSSALLPRFAPLFWCGGKV